MSLKSNVLQTSAQDEHNRYRNSFAAANGAEFSDMSWPTRMVQQRHAARKSNYTKTLTADLLLDMPNLSNHWSELHNAHFNYQQTTIFGGNTKSEVGNLLRQTGRSGNCTIGRNEFIGLGPLAEL